MTRLSSLEVSSFVVHIAAGNIKFELHTDNFDEFSFTELRDKVAEIFGFSNITSKLLEQETLGPRIIGAYRKLATEKRQIDGYIISLMGYAWTPFRGFERYLGMVVGLDRTDIQLTLTKYNSNFVTNDFLPPGIY